MIPCDPTGASKLYTSIPVPDTALTVTSAHRAPDTELIAPASHTTVVSELHELVPHVPPPTTALAVCSPYPKFSPVTVTDAPPV